MTSVIHFVVLWGLFFYCETVRNKYSLLNIYRIVFLIIDYIYDSCLISYHLFPHHESIHFCTILLAYFFFYTLIVNNEL